MSSITETIYNHISYLFNNKNWRCRRTNNQVCFNNTFRPCDEYLIEIQPTSTVNKEKINVCIPLNDITYKSTFYSSDDVIEFIKLHANIYAGNEYNKWQ